MPASDFIEKKSEDRVIETAHDPVPKSQVLFIDITFFHSLLRPCFEAIGVKNRQKAIEALLASEEWVRLHTDRQTDCSVYTEKKDMDHEHEISTARALTAMDYDVLFVPTGMFSKEEKKFDVFLIRGHVILKAEMKCISSKNPDTIAKRIKEGLEQASRIVLDIVSDIETRTLIDGLRSGIERRSGLKELLLFYRNRFYRLTRQEILGKNIFKILS